MDKRTKKTPSVDVAMAKARKYCALQERSIAEVKKKLQDYGMLGGDIPVMIDKLKKEGFLNEMRFASSFASGKFRHKKWGKNKIKNEMKRKGLSEELISKGLSELSQEEYKEALDGLLRKKWGLLERKIEEGDYQSRRKAQQKLMVYAVNKGYEHDMVMKRMGEMGIFRD